MEILKAMEHAPLPLDEVIYEPSIEELEGLKIADEMKELNDFRSQIYTPCKEVLDCRLVAKRISALFE